MKQLFVAVMTLMVNLAVAGDTMLALGRTSVGTRLGYDLIPNGNIPIVELNVDTNHYPHGVVPRTVKVKYLTTVWGHSQWMPTSIRTSFVIYDEGNEANALARSPQGARAVAHAQTREFLAEDGRAMLFTDEANFQLDRYLPPGRYQVFAYIDISGPSVLLSEVLPYGTHWWNALGNTDGSAVLTKNGRIDRSYSTVASLEFAPLTPNTGLNIAPKLSMENVGDSVRVTWNSVFPDYTLEAQEIGSSTWAPVSVTGRKEVFVVSTDRYSGNTYGFGAVIPCNTTGALFRLVPGGMTEATGEGLSFPVTQR